MTSFLRDANDYIKSASVVFMQENIQLHDDLKVRLFWSADMVSCFFELPSPYTKKILFFGCYLSYWKTHSPRRTVA